MIPSDFSDYFKSCTPEQQQWMVEELIRLSSEKVPVNQSDESQAIDCPHCQSKSVRANGKLKGVQRYFCKSCEKNFSETTGKFWYALKKKDKVKRYLYCLLSGYSIRKSAKETGIAIQTSFDWRHKLLNSFSVIAPKAFQGIKAPDSLFFPHPEKGNRKLIELLENEAEEHPNRG